jgi:hypothetical protein
LNEKLAFCFIKTKLRGKACSPHNDIIKDLGLWGCDTALNVKIVEEEKGQEKFVFEDREVMPSEYTL